MTLALPLLNAIGRAVHQGRGNMGDVEDLVRVWERLESDMQARVDRMHHAANTVRCCCSHGGRDARQAATLDALRLRVVPSHAPTAALEPPTTRLADRR